MSRSFLVTGGSDGIGLEVAKQLLAQGHKVFVGARSRAKFDEAFGAGAGGAEFVELDLGNADSVAKAAGELAARTGGTLDGLVNNAGVGHVTRGAEQRVGNVNFDLVKDALDINVVGTMRVTEAVLPLLRRSASPTVVFVSTDMASTTMMATSVGNPKSPLHHVHLVAYNTSKAALSSYAVAVAASFPEARVNVVTPGYTATKLNGFGKGAPGAKTPSAAAAILVKFAVLDKDGPTGKFFGADGSEKTW